MTRGRKGSRLQGTLTRAQPRGSGPQDSRVPACGLGAQAARRPRVLSVICSEN